MGLSETMRKQKATGVSTVSASKKPRKSLKTESPRGLVRISAENLRRFPPGKTNWGKFDAMTDEDIARAVANDPDAAPLDLDWSKTKIYYPKGKLPVSLRVDADVFAFFKANRRGYQTRMNAVLRSYVEHELGKKSGK